MWATSLAEGDPRLSVGLIVGIQRERAQRVLDRLAGQTIAASIEVIVVDTRPAAARLALPGVAAAIIVPGSPASLGEARAAVARLARGEIVAYLEDHCYPDPRWAEALVGAYRQPWAAVGYAIAHANPHSRSGRGIHLATYGEWQSPPAGETTALPGSNVSYRRDMLLSFGDELPALLLADFNLHARMRQLGLRMAVEPAARTKHESEESLINGVRSSLVYSWVLAAERARLGGWTSKRRLAWALGNLWAAPLLRLGGLLRGQQRRPRELARLVPYLPAAAIVLLGSAVGEMLGFLLGEADSSMRLTYWELDAPRARRP